MKICGHCKKFKEYFFIDNNRKEGLSSWCKECISDRHQRDYKLKIKPKCRSRLLKKLYGLSLADYNAKLIAQDHRCAICRKHQLESIRAFAVDHNHTTGQIRALLCPGCNWKIGFLETVALTPYQDYLDKFNEVKI